MRLVSNKLSLFAVVAGLTLFGSACNKSKVSGGAQTATPDTPGDTAPGAGDAEVVEDEENVEDEFGAGYGLLNFRQLAATYESLTGVQLNNQDVLAEYERQLASLPKDFDAASISAAKVSASTKLAATYCDVMSQNDGLLTARFATDIAGFEALGSAEYASTILDGFYGPETALQGDRTADIATVVDLVDTLKAVQVGNNPAGPEAVFMGTCAAVISTAEFTMY
ncbi:MAG: hypothetical protein HRU19_04820 [Pseudobacteriovorax sp.]|nr:hypothetical protein [Pseudobacteriovorax sp.]